MQLLMRVKPILDEIWPQIEDRYRAIHAENQALALQAPDSPLSLSETQSG